MAIVQTALLLPLLLSLTFGTIEFGQYFYIRHAFQAAARDVGRVACLSTASQSDPVTRATATLQQANVTFDSTWMTIVNLSQSRAVVTDCSSVRIGDVLEITMKCKYGQITNALRPLYSMTSVGIPSTKLVYAQCQMIKE